MDDTVSAGSRSDVSNDFGSRTIACVCETLRADWGCFYLLDDKAEPNTFSPYEVPPELYQGYIERNMRDCDPLHPGFLRPQDCRKFTLVEDPSIRFPEHRLERYQKFLKSFGIRHAGEMVFRYEGKPVAGLSLLWRGKDVSPESTGFGMSLHSYVEFNFGAQLRPAQMQMPPQVDLTQREREVARFACAGCTNAEIARRLSIGIATVKTHLVNIFGKLGVSNRTALVNRMLGQKGSAAYQ